MTYAQELIAEGYYQVSRSARMLSKIPHGMTGKEALLAHEVAHAQRTQPADIARAMVRDAQQWVAALSEESAGDHYLRCCAKSIQVTALVFAEFRLLGGRTYR